ncbi:MAG: hypothetical protein JEZ03_11215 [Bacteroidales bacterium]|nr:hypothetical protein [Bacteroidales bacterium]
MNRYLEGFKQDLFNTIMDLTGKSFLKILLAYTAISIIMIGMMWVFFNLGLGLNMSFLTQLSDPEAIKDLTSQLEFTQLSFGFYVFAGIFVVLMMLISTWNINLFLIISNQFIVEGSCNLKYALSQSINRNVIIILLAILLFYVMLIAGIVFSVALASVSGFITFLMIIVLILFLLKFAIVIPAISLNNISFADAFAFSFHHITWKRSLKLFMIIIIFMILMMIFGLVFSLIYTALTVFPNVGVVIQLVTQIVLGALMASFVSAATIGLYYRYAEFDQQSESMNSGNEELHITES